MEINYDFSVNDKILTILLPQPVFDIDQEIYSQTGETLNTRNISGMWLSCKKKGNQVWENWTASKNIN